MEIIVGKLAGFCGGVVNSVLKTEKLLDENGAMYCLGELVHNKQVVDKLSKKGLVLVEDIKEVPDNSSVIIRAHGIRKDVYEYANLHKIQLYDLTCPNVLSIHEEVLKLVNNGYFIVLIAQKDHPEAIGTISFCGSNSVILEKEEEIDKIVNNILDKKFNKVAIISQTTFSVAKFNLFTDLLKKKLNLANNLLVNNTICAATDKRQEETKELSIVVDAMIIIGGKNSSNTKKLYEIALNNCDRSFIVETVDELKKYDLSNINVVGVMAGASTPKESIEDVVNYLEKM